MVWEGVMLFGCESHKVSALPKKHHPASLLILLCQGSYP